MGSIELRGIAVEHAGHTVLRDVDLRVEDGEVVALLGRSGSGKSTLLRAVAGLHPVETGSVLLGGRDVTSVPTSERDLGMVMQGAPLIEERDVEGNLMFPLEVRGDSRDASRQRAGGEALRFGLSRLLGRTPKTLSTGERAAAATARSVMRAPSALLLDEPAVHLDPQTRARVLQQVGIIQRTRGTTILLATNDLGVASALAHRIAVLDRDTVAQVAALAQLLADPVTLDVADLVHPAPLTRIEGQLEVGTGGRPNRVRTAAGDVATWDRRVRDHDGPLVVGLSQHDLTIAADGELEGRVARVATTGARRLVTVDTAAGPVVVAVDGRDAVPDAGTRVSLRVQRVLLATPEGDVLAVVERP